MKCDWQYQIRHTKTDAFKIGQTVFITSGAQIEWAVEDVKEKEIIISRFIKKNLKQRISIIPEAILQFKHAALQIYKEKFKICLN